MSGTDTSLPTPGLRLLSLDGGGIRGFSILLIIDRILRYAMEAENAERRKNGRKDLLTEPPKPCEYFDLIGGTSTGGIAALMLGRLQMSIDEAIERYDELLENVFRKTKQPEGGRLWMSIGEAIRHLENVFGTTRKLDQKFKAKPLEDEIKALAKKYATTEDALLETPETDEICKTFVVARNTINMNANIPVLFRSYDSTDMSQPGCKIWEAARATSAHPDFFEPIIIGRGQPYIDGGIGRNNPAPLLAEEAAKIWPDRKIACIISIGAGQNQVIELDQGLTKTFKDMAADCEATHETMFATYLNHPHTRYYRLNVEQGMQFTSWAEWEKLAKVEAHTTNYLAKKELQAKLKEAAQTLSEVQVEQNVVREQRLQEDFM